MAYITSLLLNIYLFILLLGKHNILKVGFNQLSFYSLQGNEGGMFSFFETWKPSEEWTPNPGVADGSVNHCSGPRPPSEMIILNCNGSLSSALNPLSAKISLYRPCFFSIWNRHKLLVWIPTCLLWVYGHWNCFNSFIVGIVFRRQILKAIPALKGVKTLIVWFTAGMLLILKVPCSPKSYSAQSYTLFYFKWLFKD